MAIKVNPSTLTAWDVQPVVRETGVYAVCEDGHAIFMVHGERAAKIAAAAPRLLTLLGLMAKRPNAPAALDIGRVLALCGLEFDHDR